MVRHRLLRHWVSLNLRLFISSHLKYRWHVVLLTILILILIIIILRLSDVRDL